MTLSFLSVFFYTLFCGVWNQMGTDSGDCFFIVFLMRYHFGVDQKSSIGTRFLGY